MYTTAAPHFRRRKNLVVGLVVLSILKYLYDHFILGPYVGSCILYHVRAVTT
jgi:hypothetical protein